ncbi:SDR family NAD(P)-dependent oxidoreductase [Nonomuraea phyllanthi]|uniref:SDR family NAD(P)-dependent oxidoreductase n=1 Tax=Nonomuraea phyllanthi TaxID=2219224 RepID=A0A5C4W535_9ACTN|nr:SDR family NAD(P)-dependent oxidoreductase [Nonomuraea phyllanthi]KAB8192008.1 SDR family NAD(P)-dependent oxidoreductase [Nonomuraea phyllanthi]QFY09909.1 SDR family NAD(P)-dependent oxidoreductase [Nonomuraea phyllanthi]
MTNMETIALVTGAGQGIGHAIAAGLAGKGMTVYVGARDARRREAAVERLRAAGGDAHGIALDVTAADTVAAAAEEITARHGRLDVLVNNAGITGDRRQIPGAGTDVPAEVRRVFETNLFGVIAVTEAMLPLLLRSPAGRVVNVSGRAGSLTAMATPDGEFAGLPPLLGYPPSKAAVNAVTLQYAKHLRPHGILVNAVCPGHTATEGNGFTGDRTAEQGAAIAVRMATLGPDGPTGTFADDQGPIAW